MQLVEVVLYVDSVAEWFRWAAAGVDHVWGDALDVEMVVGVEVVVELGPAADLFVVVGGAFGRWAAVVA